MVTREEKEKLCECGHRRAEHFGKDRLEDCCAETGVAAFCKCKRFREANFKSEEEVEMARKSGGKKSDGAKRSRKSYGFNVEKARSLRDESYKEKDNSVARMLRALIEANRESYMAVEIFELANKKDAGLKDVNMLPIGNLIKNGALITTKKTKQEAKSLDKPRRERKLRAKKTEVRTETAAAQAEATPF